MKDVCFYLPPLYLVCFVTCTEFVFLSMMLMIDTVNWVFCKQTNKKAMMYAFF